MLGHFSSQPGRRSPVGWLWRENRLVGRVPLEVMFTAEPPDLPGLGVVVVVAMSFGNSANLAWHSGHGPAGHGLDDDAAGFVSTPLIPAKVFRWVSLPAGVQSVKLFAKLFDGGYQTLGIPAVRLMFPGRVTSKSRDHAQEYSPCWDICKEPGQVF